MSGVFLLAAALAAGDTVPGLRFAPDPAAWPEPPALLEPAARAPDPWLAEDKIQHFAMSFAATAIGYGTARFVLDPQPARAAAGGVAVVLGIGKEVSDFRSGGPFSLKDLVWDAAGVALGLVLVAHTR